jgi:hypothetical protein
MEVCPKCKGNGWLCEKYPGLHCRTLRREPSVWRRAFRATALPAHTCCRTGLSG